VKAIEPTPLVREAAAVLEPFCESVVVVGAIAVEIALSDQSAAITPTRDIDVVVPTTKARPVVDTLEAFGFTASDVPHEAGFTWNRGDLKVQLVRTFHPFPDETARRLPQNPVFGMAGDPVHRDEIAFVDDPQRVRLTCANPLCLLALKQAAFGRVRHDSDNPVERDYHDAYLLASHCREELVADWSSAGYHVRQRAKRALVLLAGEGTARSAAARQMVAIGDADDLAAAEIAIERATSRALRALAAVAPAPAR
jgi:hypothetical protein